MAVEWATGPGSLGRYGCLSMSSDGQTTSFECARVGEDAGDSSPAPARRCFRAGILVGARDLRKQDVRIVFKNLCGYSQSASDWYELVREADNWA